MAKKKQHTPESFTYDRFIPQRRRNSSDSPLDYKKNTVAQTMYEQLIQDNLRDPNDNRVLLFSPLKEQQPYQMLKVSFNQPQKTKPSPPKLHFQAGRIMDAPGTLDDFYSNTLACTHDQVIVSLNEVDNRSNLPFSRIYNTSALNLATNTPYRIASTEPTAFGTTVRAISPMTQTDIVSGWSDGFLRIHNLERLTYYRTFHTQEASAISTIQSLTAFTFVCGDFMGNLRLIDLRSQQAAVTIHISAHREKVSGLAYNNEFNIASGSNDNTVKLWDIRHLNRTELLSHQGHSAGIKALSFYGTHHLLSGGGTACKKICLFNTQLNVISNTKMTHGQITGIQHLQDPRYIVTSHGYGQNTLNLWYVSKKNQIVAVSKTSADTIQRDPESPTNGRFISLIASPTQDTLVALKTDETLRFFDISHKRQKGMSKKTTFLPQEMLPNSPTIR
ncbi:MAG: WD40 repeat domain-containing protein [Legionellaceae bacterium]|nr:WD40 repeat domain-containing protein [Legionellaceae bacterium]